MRWTRLSPLLLALAAPSLTAQEGGRTLHGRLLTPDGAPAEGVRVLARAGGWSDSVAVDPDGRFSIPVPEPGGGVEMEVDAADPAARRHHRVLARFAPADLWMEQRVVLVPLRWRVRAGVYAGSEVEISMRRAFGEGCGDCPAYYHERQEAPPGRPEVPTATWPASVFPLRVAFAPEGVRAVVPARDSVAFWSAAEGLERDLGRDLFRPARYIETLPTPANAEEDVIFVEFNPRLRKVGWGSTVSQKGDIFYGAVRVRNAQVFSGSDGPRLVKHELMHTLGVGHTCAWRSAMAEPRCPGMMAQEVTPEDVAYLEVLLAVRDLQRSTAAQHALEAALRGERR